MRVLYCRAGSSGARKAQHARCRSHASHASHSLRTATLRGGYSIVSKQTINPNPLCIHCQSILCLCCARCEARRCICIFTVPPHRHRSPVRAATTQRMQHAPLPPFIITTITIDSSTVQYTTAVARAPCGTRSARRSSPKNGLRVRVPPPHLRRQRVSAVAPSRVRVRVCMCVSESLPMAAVTHKRRKNT